MEVADGSQSQVAYQRLISGQLNAEEKAHLKQAMLDYCRKDTIAMVNMVEWLRNAGKDGSGV